MLQTFLPKPLRHGMPHRTVHFNINESRFHETAGGECLPCLGCDCGRISESLSILPHRQGAQPEGGF